MIFFMVSWTSGSLREPLLLRLAREHLEPDEVVEELLLALERRRSARG